MNWLELTDEQQIATIKEESKTKPVVIFKHSTRCSISSMAHNRLEKLPKTDDHLFYYLDLIRYRPVSNLVAEAFAVHHESPQVLVIANGECTYEESHNGITVAELEEQIQEAGATLRS